MNAAELLIEARTRSGLSQRALARLAGTSQSAVARYEGGHADPTLATLTRLLAATGFEIAGELVAARHEAELADLLLAVTPTQRLRTLRRYAALQQRATSR